MQVENHKEEVPFSHYQELFRSADPQAIAKRLPRVAFDGKTFSVKLLGVDYSVAWPEAEITPAAPLPKQTFLLRWLLEGQDIAHQGNWLTFREMPWGELYIKPYTGRVLTRAAFTFGTRVAAFRAACEKLGATPVAHGDAGYEFSFLEGYAMRILVWEGDDEFPPNAQVLYSDNFSAGVAPEDRVVAGDLLITHIKAAM